MSDWSGRIGQKAKLLGMKPAQLKEEVESELVALVAREIAEELKAETVDKGNPVVWTGDPRDPKPSAAA